MGISGVLCIPEELFLIKEVEKTMVVALKGVPIISPEC